MLFGGELKNAVAFVERLFNIICTRTKVEVPKVCESLGGQMRDEVVYIIGQTVVDPRQVCGMFFANCGQPYDPVAANWSIKIDSSIKPAVNPEWPTPVVNASSMRILHLADIHFDPYYSPGSEVNCNEPLCCRDASTPPANKSGKSPHSIIKSAESRRAGQWGSFGSCDIPMATVEAIFDHIARNEQFDYVIWTGDLMPHDVWNYSRPRATRLLHTLTAMAKKYFAHKIVLAAVGNHEGVPSDSFPTRHVPHRFSNQWLYDALANQWRHFYQKLDTERKHIVE